MKDVTKDAPSAFWIVLGLVVLVAGMFFAYSAGAGVARAKKVVEKMEADKAETTAKYEKPVLQTETPLSDMEHDLLSFYSQNKTVRESRLKVDLRIKDMRIGDTVWVSPGGFVIDKNRKMWVGPKVRTKEKYDFLHTVQVKRDRRGFHVSLNGCEDCEWEPEVVENEEYYLRILTITDYLTDKDDE